jgi:hypothetical protein
MFNLAEALRPFAGKTCDNLRDVLRILGQVRWDNLINIPAGWQTDDLYDKAVREGLLTENNVGTFTFTGK